MRRALAVFAMTVGTLGIVDSPASAASSVREQRCPNAGGKVNGTFRTVARKITTKGMECEAARKFWSAFGTGAPTPKGTGALRASCKKSSGTPEDMAAAEEQGRVIYRCKSRKVTTTAWILQG